MHHPQGQKLEAQNGRVISHQRGGQIHRSQSVGDGVGSMYDGRDSAHSSLALVDLYFILKYGNTSKNHSFVDILLIYECWVGTGLY